MTLSRFLNSIGSAIYDIVFLSFAASMYHSSVAVNIANITMVVPILFTVFIGIASDRTRQKACGLLTVGYLQAFLFTIVAIVIHQATYFSFSVVCLCNIMSDLLADYRGGLSLPMIQRNVPKIDLMEAYSFTTVVSYMCTYLGQVLGVWMLTVSNNNYSIVALANALPYVLASLVLLFIKDRLVHNPVPKKKKNISLLGMFSDAFRNVKIAYEKSESINFVPVLISFIILNALSSSTTFIYNISLLTHPLFTLTYNQSLLVIRFLIIVGIIIGGLTPHDYIAQRSISTLIIINAVTAFAIGLVNILQMPLLGILILFFDSYMSGKTSPKFNAMLMSNLPSDVLAQTNNFVAFMFMTSIPIGTTIFSTIATRSVLASWIAYFVLSVIAVILGLPRWTRRRKTSDAREEIA